jgi:TRAP-type uncharacterized transport system fused permease subunit
METGLAAFRFALIGFALPFAFVLQPQLLQLAPDGEAAGWWPVLRATSSVLFGTVCLAAAVTGQLRGGLTWPLRAGLLGLAGLFCFVPLGGVPWWAHGTGLVAGTAVAFRRRR